MNTKHLKLSLFQGKLPFELPFDLPDELLLDCVPLSQADFSDEAAVYVIVCIQNNKYRVIDVGQTGQLRSRIEDHEREKCWRRECRMPGEIFVCVYRMPSAEYSKQDRLTVEKQIRDSRKPPCGQR